MRSDSCINYKNFSSFAFESCAPRGKTAPFLSPPPPFRPAVLFSFQVCSIFIDFPRVPIQEEYLFSLESISNNENGTASTTVYRQTDKRTTDGDNGNPTDNDKDRLTENGLQRRQTTTDDDDDNDNSADNENDKLTDTEGHRQTTTTENDDNELHGNRA